MTFRKDCYILVKSKHESRIQLTFAPEGTSIIVMNSKRFVLTKFMFYRINFNASLTVKSPQK